MEAYTIVFKRYTRSNLLLAVCVSVQEILDFLYVKFVSI